MTKKEKVEKTEAELLEEQAVADKKLRAGKAKDIAKVAPAPEPEEE